MFTACEQETLVYPDISEPKHKICVTATLDTEQGQFYVSVSKVRQLLEYGLISEQIPEVRTGRVKLYEDGIPIVDVEQEFDLCEVLNTKKLSLNGVSAKAGSDYQLEVSVEGYDPVTACATMPDAPVVRKIEADTLTLVNKHHIYSASSWQLRYGSDRNELYPFHMTMEDRAESGGYYSIQMFVNFLFDDSTKNFTDIYPIGSDDWGILSSNPEMEAKETVWAEEIYELYAFTPFLFDNLSFANTTKDIKFYLPYPPRDEYYRPANAELVQVKQYITLKRLSEETYKYYRGICLQYQGLDFFHSEPVTLPSNIQNGYGCFSLSNSVNFTILEYSTYYY